MLIDDVQEGETDFINLPKAGWPAMMQALHVTCTHMLMPDRQFHENAPSTRHIIHMPHPILQADKAACTVHVITP